MSGDRLPGWSHVCPRAKEHANITLLFLNLCKKILVVLQSARCMKTWPSKKSRKTLKREANFCLINQVFGCTAQNCQFCHSDIHILVLNHISRCRGFLKKWCSIPTVLSTLRDCRVSRSSQSVSSSFLSRPLLLHTNYNYNVHLYTSLRLLLRLLQAGASWARFVCPSLHVFVSNTAAP